MKHRSSTEPYRAGYFDKKGEIPKTVFGYETPQAKRTIRLMGSIALQSRNIFKPKNNNIFEAAMVAKYHTNDLLRVAPLVEKATHGEVLPQDVAEHRKELKRLAKRHSAALRWADRGCRLLSIIGIGIPMRMALNRKFDQTVADKLPGVIQTAREYIPTLDAKVEPYFTAIERIEGGPKALVARDISKITNMVSTHANPGNSARSLKSVGQGIRITADAIYSDPNSLESYTWANRYLGISLPQKPVQIPDIAYELIASTLLGEFGRCLPEGQRDQAFCENIGNLRHPLTSVAEFNGSYETARYKIKSAGEIARSLPEDSGTPRRVYENLKTKLGA